MFKQKLSTLGKKLLKPSQFSIINPQQIFFGSQHKKQDNSRKSSAFTYTSSAISLGIGYLAYQEIKKRDMQKIQAEEKKEEEQSAYEKLKEKIEIPLLLLQRQKEKEQEYKSRAEVDVKEIEKDITEEDMKQMQELDQLYGHQQSDRSEEIDDADVAFIKDPYAKAKQTLMQHQEFRTIKVGPPDLLKNGQMIQVSVCDPFDDKKFHPTDKIIIACHNDKYYATGSFCGFDYTNLATGAFIGDKLICPTCGSNYNIMNGFVDQGPSLRNISSFLIQIREEMIQLVMPEHVPAFAKKKFIKRATIDPRNFVILGDSETALSAIDALRTNFTGRIIVIPSSPYGQFENLDILNKKFGKIHKNEAYMVEEDYLDRANVDVVKGEIKTIDLAKKTIVVRGIKDAIYYDKIMIAWGSHKQRLQKEYSNVFSLEDRQSHARCHNEILKAKTIVVMGGTFEAYQTASSIREYLDSIGYEQTQIMLLEGGPSEVQRTFGSDVSFEIHQMLREQRISVLMNADITRMTGLNEVDGIYFKKPEYADSSEKNVEYYIKPDVIIAENGLGSPKYDLSQVLAPAANAENGEPPLKLGIDPQGIPASDIRFSLHYNDIHSPIFAAGSCTQYPSFLHKVRLRTQDIRYNIEAGFFAAMNMMDKRVEFRYIPFTPMKIKDTPIYFVGERGQPFHEIIINGDIEKRKFVAFYVYGNEITGFMTCGYKNLHLYLWEAMKLLVMPPATQLRNRTIDYKAIVQKVLQMRPYIACKRHDIISIPSVILAEFDNELEKSLHLSIQVKQNIDEENQIQKKKFQELKKKYDREGIQYVQDEMEMANKNQGPDEKAYTMSGARKPGQTSTKDSYRSHTQHINMGQDNDNQKNPLSTIFNAAKSKISG